MGMLVGLVPFVHLSAMAWGGVSLAEDRHLWSVAFMLGLEAFFLLIVWGFASMKRLTMRAAFGLSWRHAARAIGQGLLGYVAVFPWVFGLLWLMATVSQWIGFEPPMEPIHELLFLEPRPLVLGLTLVLACLIGPIVEEIFFRGVVFSALRTRTGRVWAMLASGSLFAVVHTNPVGFLPILLLGCLLADLYERTGSLLASITVHILHNSLLISLGLLTKQLMTS
jgi:membrane protease YdiL (CAAX protease family)